MSSTIVWVLRFLHILAGVSWVGGAFLWSMVIAPRLLARGPQPIRRPVLEALIDAVPRFFAGSGIATIVFGVLLVGAIAGWANFFSTFTDTGGYGDALGVGLVLALVALVVGFAVITPTAKRMLAVLQSLPAPAPGAPPAPPPASVQQELQALGRRLGIASMMTVVLGTIIVGAMAWAVNYVR